MQIFSTYFWLYPNEDNAFRRLPVINSSLPDMFVLPGSKPVWAVGDGGLSWQQQTVADQALPAAKLREDSQTFAGALEIWYELIALSNPIPRNVKAFFNQLCYFANREFKGENIEKREAQWVALAVAFYTFDDDMDKVFAVEKNTGNEK